MVGFILRIKSKLRRIQKSKKNSIIFLSGLTDIEKSGNQSFKNTLLGYLSQSWHIRVFTLMPTNYKNLEDISMLKGIEKNNYKRLPESFKIIFNFFERIKNSIGLKKTINKSHKHLNIPDANQRYNLFGRLIYFLLPFISFFIDFPRVSISIFLRRPSVIYGVNSQGAFSASIIGRIYRIPIITRFHGTIIHPLHLNSNLEKLKVFHEYNAIKMYSDLQIMTNDGTKGDLILSKLRHKVKKQLFIMNGIDDVFFKELERLRKEKNNLSITNSKKEFNFITVSRLDKWKRVDIAINAFYKLINELNINKINLNLFIVGSGPCEKELKELAEKLQLKNRVNFYGAINYKEIAELYSKSNCLLSFYEHTNRGNPIFESMLAGLNIISVDDGSIEDLIEHNVSGFLCSKENLIDDCFNYMLTLIKNPDLCNSMKNKIKNKTSEYFIPWSKRMQKEINEVNKIIKYKNLN